jgi:hypothetical protein
MARSSSIESGSRHREMATRCVSLFERSSLLAREREERKREREKERKREREKERKRERGGEGEREREMATTCVSLKLCVHQLMRNAPQWRGRA